LATLKSAKSQIAKGSSKGVIGVKIPGQWMIPPANELVRCTVAKFLKDTTRVAFVLVCWHHTLVVGQGCAFVYRFLPVLKSELLGKAPWLNAVQSAIATEGEPPWLVKFCGQTSSTGDPG
jgi:hypothetical protein